MAGQRSRVARLFERACGLEPRDRAAFLLEACGNAPELLLEVESLLSYCEASGGVLDVGVSQTGRNGGESPSVEQCFSGTSWIGRRFDEYRVIEFLGEGGMGQVFLSEQEGPVRRRVALKVLRIAGSHEIVARFETERHALARMSHPNIARIFHAGNTPEGLPYFTMEYVPGPPITEFCERRSLGLSERLQLFVQVCDGVQHAHRRGIIHRDLKPSNILVSPADDMDVPKIIDFGLAKALHHSSVGTDPITKHGFAIGTPAYMSPEQATDGGDLDTRTDVYSLGVVLYQLLTGALPTDAIAASRAGSSGVPVAPPSACVYDARSSSGSLSAGRALSQDLDWITMKAIEKDRGRRYAHVSEMSADIQRYLNGEPVLAGPPGTMYRVQKFVRRHRTAAVASIAVIVSLVGGLGASVNYAARAERARERAEVAQTEASTAMRAAQVEARKAQSVMEFLRRILLEASPQYTGGETVGVVEVLRTVDDALESQLIGNADVDAAVLITVGEVYSQMGLFERAQARAERALALLEAMVEKDHHRLARAEMLLGHISSRTADVPTTQAHWERALAHFERSTTHDPSEVALLLTALASVKQHAGQRAEAERDYRALVENLEHQSGQELALGNALVRLASLEVNSARYDRAEKHLRQAGILFERIELDDRYLLGLVHYHVARLHLAREEWDGALGAVSTALEIMEGAFGAEHSVVLSAHIYRARALSGLGLFEQADGDLRAALAAYQEKPTALAWKIPMRVELGHAFSARMRGDEPQALRHLRQSLALGEATGNAKESLEYATAHMECGQALMQLENWHGAASHFRECLEIRQARLSRRHPRSRVALEGLCAALLAAGGSDSLAAYSAELAAWDSTLGGQ